MSLLLKGIIRNGKVEVNEPIDLPEGTELIVAPEAERGDDGPVPPEKISYVLAAMRWLQPMDIPDATAADLDAWERKLNRHGIDHMDASVEDLFR